MTDWTEPSHVTPNTEIESDVHNAEVIDNLKHLHEAKVGRFGKTAALTVPDTTWVSFGWDFAQYETSEMWAVSPYPERITPPVAGFWMVNVRISWPAGTGVRAVRLQQNGTTLIAQDNREALVTTSYTSLMGVVEMDGVGDYFNLHVWQNSGADVTIPALSTHSIDVLLPRG